MTQGKLKTLLRPHSFLGPVPHNQPKCSPLRKGQGRAPDSSSPSPDSSRPSPRSGPPGPRGRPPRAAPLPSKGVRQGSHFSPSSGQQLQAWAMTGLIRFHDPEIPVRTSQSSPGPGPAPEGECAPPQGACSPKILAHLARSAGAPAAVGLPWGSHHTPTANMGIGKRGRM